MYNTSWNDFIGKNSNNLTAAFEDLARYLFRKKYDVSYALPYFKNHPGNETAVIKRGDEVIGFQAKYFENEIDATNIIHSIQLAKKWCPEQTLLVIYTNKEFGIPKTIGNVTSQKQDNIQKVAKDLGLRLEWMFGDNILDVVKETPVAYDIYFNQKSHLQNLNHDLEECNEAKLSLINDNIKYGDKNISIERYDYIEKIKTSVEKKQNLVLTGESGVGKSAIIKHFYNAEKENDKLVVFALDARQLDTNTVNDIFSLVENYTLKEFCDYYQDIQTKLIYIDSAEKLLEIKNISSLTLFIDKLKREGWIFLFTCKSNSLKNFLEVMENDHHLGLDTLEVKSLSTEELESFASKQNITLPEDKKLLNQLRTPFYLARYVEIGQNARLQLSTFKEKVWSQKVRGTTKGGAQVNRAECLISIASKLQESSLYYVSYSEINNQDAAYSLVEQDVLAEVMHKGYAIKHDIYSDWALEYYVDQKMSASIENLEVIPKTSDFQNAFVCWLQEQLDKNASVADTLCKRIFDNEIDDFWASSIFYAIGKSQNYSSHFLSKYDYSLKSNNYHWFNEFAKELYISCQKINRYFSFNGRQYPQFVAFGGGWEATIEYIFKNQDDYFLKNAFVVYNILSGFLGKQPVAEDAAHHAGLLALRIFKEEIQAQENGTHLYIENSDLWCSLVCLYSPYLKEELQSIFNDIIKNKWIDYKDPYHHLSEFIVKKANTSLLLPIAILYHGVVPDLLQLYWEERLDDKDHNSWRSSYKESEYYFGLNEELEGIGGYFPSSAYQTPIYTLLKTEFDISPKLHHTFDFIIDFVNQCVETYSVRAQSYDELENIEVTSPNGKQNTIVASQVLWNMYRGTSGLSMPNVLECIHMALEKFLLELCNKQNLHDYVENLLEQILNKSRSASMWAIVASVVTAHFEDFFNILLCFFQNYRFLGLDLTRFTHELTAHTLSFAYVGKEQLGKERKESNELTHRRNHLENVLQSLQISYSDSTKPQDKARLQLLYGCVEHLKKQVAEIPQEEKDYEDYMIARIDYRSMIKEEVTLKNGIKALQLTPNLTDAQKNAHQELEKSNIQMARGVRLREWINKQYEGNKDELSKSPFDNDIHLVLDEIRHIENLLKSKDGTLYKLMGDEFLPYMGSSVLLMNFSSEMTDGEIKECKERVLESLQDMPFILSNSLSGLDICLNAIPILLAFCNPNEMVIVKKICLDYVRSTFKYGNTRPCDLMRYMLIRRKVWQDHTDFMEECIHELVETNKNQVFSLDLARAIVCLLANSSSHRNLFVKSMEALSSEWIPDMRHGYEHYSQDRFEDADLVADIIINCHVPEVSEVIPFFSRYISTHDKYEPLVSRLLLKCVSYGNYEQFWAAWYSLYDCIIKNIGKRDYSNVVNEYLLNPSYLNDDRSKWFELKEKDVPFFEKVLTEAGDNPSVLGSVVKVFDTIGYDYSLKIVPIIASVIENKTVYDGDQNVMKMLLVNLENLVRSVLADFETDIKNDKPLKLNIKTILMFMKQHGSTQASIFLRNI